MRFVRYGVIAVLAVGLMVTSIGWYLSAHPGGVRFESCHWEGSKVVLGYTYGSGDTVSTMVHPSGDHVVAQLRVDEAGGNHTLQVLTGQATYPVSGGPLPVRYPNGEGSQLPGPLRADVTGSGSGRRWSRWERSRRPPDRWPGAASARRRGTAWPSPARCGGHPRSA